MGSEGELLAYDQTDNLCIDFKLQKNGQWSYYDMIAQEHLLMNDAFEVQDTLVCANGLKPNHRELQVTTNNEAYLISNLMDTLDVTPWIPNGSTEALVSGLLIQKIDFNETLLFEWSSFDHFEFTDAIDEDGRLDLTADAFSYVHANSIEITPDNDIILSCRNMDEITKIDGATGEIIWRLGGKNNQFEFIGDTLGFNMQHDARLLPNGNLTLFDNGYFHNPPLARALEYELDEQNMTATLVWSYTADPPIVSSSMGSVQRLENGNTLINWGTVENESPIHFTEVNQDGNEVMRLTFEANTCYRAHKYPIDQIGFPSGVHEREQEETIKVFSDGEQLHLLNVAGKPIDFNWYLTDGQGRNLQEGKMNLLHQESKTIGGLPDIKGLVIISFERDGTMQSNKILMY